MVNNFYTQHNTNNISSLCGFGVRLPSGYKIHGIDVSRHQGTIDWKRVSKAQSGDSKLTFVFIKATEGITHRDENFAANWRNSASAGMLRGAYHYFYPSRDAALQAENFIRVVKLGRGDLPPVVDIEHTSGHKAGDICKSLKIFTEKLENHYGVKPLIYTNIHFYNTILKGLFDDYPLWISCYYEHERFYSEFGGPWIFWQHSERGRVDGIKSKTDLNVFDGSEADLRKMCLN